MIKEHNHFEMIQKEQHMPFACYVHTKDVLRSHGHLDESGKLFIPKLMEHWHKALEINYIFSGTWHYLINGKTVHLSGGEFVVINCGDIHSVDGDIDMAEEEVLGYTLLVDEDFVKEIIPDMEQCVFMPEIIRGNARVKRLLQDIYACFVKEPGTYKGIAILGMIHLMLYEFCVAGAKEEKTVISINSQKDIERLRGIIQYVEVHYTEALASERVADRFYFSRSYFAKFFKHYTGMTFKEYVTKYRLTKAMRLVLETDLNMTDVAMRAGFSDTRRFIITCKKYYGVTPYQYRLEHVRGTHTN